MSTTLSQCMADVKMKMDSHLANDTALSSCSADQVEPNTAVSIYPRVLELAKGIRDTTERAELVSSAIGELLDRTSIVSMTITKYCISP